MQWYFEINGSQEGPVEDHALQAMVAQGRITAQTMVWHEGMTNWQPYASLASQQVPQMSMGPSSFAPPMHMPMPNSGLAIASMVCGISSVAGVFCFVIGLAAIPAIMCGHMALSQIKKSTVPMGGRGMAIAGLITGYLAVSLLFLSILASALFAFNANGTL
jgi:hypothetical protein